MYKRGSPKAGWCQGTLLGLVSFCLPKDEDPELGVSQVVSPMKEIKYQNMFFLLLLRLLNPHIELGLPSNKLEF